MSDFGKFCIAFWIVVGLFLVGGFASKIGHKNGYKQGYSDALASIKPDTVTVVDTIREETPVEVVKWKEKEKPVYIAVHDTTTIHDSTYIVLPREFKQYRTEAYSLQISGVDPSLDWVETYNQTEYITKVVPEYKYPTFILSPTVDAYILPDSFGVGAGMELDYWANRMEFSGGIGYGVQDVPGDRLTGWYGKFSVKYNLIRK